ncbi:MAG: CBS domain-containing protein [Crenarchaeota archaeon]|nr:CBS domain-containing protein [Thermoproteota archaeon]
MRRLTVRDVMSKPVVVIGVNNTLRDAAKKMAEEGIGSLVVVDEEGNVVGIVTERDVVDAVAKGVSYDAPVSEVMTPDVMTVTPETSVLKALEMMRMHGVRHLPVATDDELVGMVSLRDLAFAVAAEMVMNRLYELIREGLEEF